MFLTELSVQQVFKKEYVLTAPLKFASKYGDFIVPKNTITDFATVPWCLQWLFRPQSKGYTKSSVLHDHLYTVRNFNRWKADCVFLEAMKSEQKDLPNKVRWFLVRWSLFSAVFIFGWRFKKGKLI